MSALVRSPRELASVPARLQTRDLVAVASSLDPRAAAGAAAPAAGAVLEALEALEGPLRITHAAALRLVAARHTDV